MKKIIYRMLILRWLTFSKRSLIHEKIGFTVIWDSKSIPHEKGFTLFGKKFYF